jgi:hypothetical protein
VIVPLALDLALSWMHPAAKDDQLVYVAATGYIYVYDATAKEQFPIGEIIPYNVNAFNLYVDGSKDLYVNGGSTILGYHRGASEPFTSYEDPNMGMISLCGTGDGTLFAPDGPLRYGAPSDTIEVFQKGHKRPVKTLYEYNATIQIGNCTADANGDVFVAYYGYDGEAIDEFPAGSDYPVTLQTLGNYADYALALDAQLDLILGAEGSLQVIAPPYTGPPIRTFGTTYGSFAFDGSGKHLWSTEEGGYAAEYDYAKGRQIWYTASLSSPGSLYLAVSPQLTP